jgi:hypothetical protein
VSFLYNDVSSFLGRGRREDGKVLGERWRLFLGGTENLAKGFGDLGFLLGLHLLWIIINYYYQL